MPIYRLPTPEEGLDGLLRMADECGYPETYQFLAWVRNIGNDQDDAPVEARKILAARMVQEELRRDPNFETARYRVATRAGHTTYTRPNFYKQVAAGYKLLGLPVPETD